MERVHRDRDEAAAVEPPAGVAPGPRLLDLQRSHGNAAVVRMLARQEATGPGAPAGPRRIDRHDILISTARGPILHENGGYEWYVTFALPFEAETDGYIIQELYQESSAMAEGGDHFWECWRVGAGSRRPVPSGDDYDDRYRNLAGPAAAGDPSGWRRHVGVARFYPGPLPSEFPGRPGIDFSVTRTRPSSWTGAGTRHDCYSEWSRGRNGLVAYAGSEELRRGTPVTFRARGG